MNIICRTGEKNTMPDFKFNIRMIKIFLFFTIITFFTPFFSVSCGSQEMAFSGFDISAGKYIGDYWQSGNPLGFIIIIPPLVMLILAFLTDRIKKDFVYDILKTIFFIVPIFDIFAVFIAKTAFQAGIVKAVDRFAAENGPFLRNLADMANLTEIRIKFGFALYVIFNIGVFVFAVINYFTKREN